MNCASFYIAGCIHSGIGYTELQKICACLNLPCIDNRVYKRYEAEVGLAIEAAAKESCKRAAFEETRMVLDKMSDLLKEL